MINLSKLLMINLIFFYFLFNYYFFKVLTLVIKIRSVYEIITITFIETFSRLELNS